MQISPETNTYIADVRRFSGDSLKHPADCAVLAESARAGAKEAVLAELCFTAKFLHKTLGILQRIGAGGEGYDTLAAEFESNIGRARDMMTDLASSMPEDERVRFIERYLDVSGAGFQSMLELIHDLNWMKNYSLDGRGQA